MGVMIRIRTVSDPELTANEHERTRALVSATWPKKDGPTHPAMAAADRSGVKAVQDHVLLSDGDELLAHAALSPRTIRHESGSLEVMALASVCVQQSRRGEGFGTRVVQEAFKAISSGRYSVALFQTQVPDFYRRLGAIKVDNEFVNSTDDIDPDATPWWDPNIMIYPDWTEWPKGKIDLKGPGY